jgi:hypothetical protein
MPFVGVDKNHVFSAQVRAVPNGTPATFKVLQYAPPAEGAAEAPAPTELQSGDEKVKAGVIAHKWKTKGPPTDGDDGQRQWRVGYTVKVTREGQPELEAASQQIDVYHDWVEVKSVAEDGSDLLNATFDLKVKQGTKVVATKKKQSTGKTGKVKIKGLPAGEIEIVWTAPFVLVEWQSSTGCNLRAKLKIVKVAKFVWPKLPAGASPPPHKQYVNQDADPKKPEQGTKIKLKLKLEKAGPSGPKAGDELWVRCSYATAQVTQRDDPVRGIVSPDAAADWIGAAPNTGKKLTVDKALEATCEVELGVSGLDAFTIDIGGSEECDDAHLNIVNWRRLWIDVLQPSNTGSNKCTDFTVFKPDRSAGLSDPILGKISSEMAKLGIEFAAIRSAFFDATHITAENKKALVSASIFGKPADKKAILCTDAAFQHLYDTKSTNRTNQRVISTVWCDFIVRGITFDRTFDLETADETKALGGSSIEWAFDEDPTGAGPGVTQFRWKTTHYESAPGVWTEITAAGDPGGSKKDWQTVALPAAVAERKAWIECTKVREVRIKLPARAGAANAGDPGHFLTQPAPGGAEGTVKVRIQVSLRFAGGRSTTNGMGWHGYIYASTRLGTHHNNGLACMLLHELGHNLGMAYADKTVDATYGRNAGKKIPGIDFPAGVATGIVYGEKGHKGTHCAAGVGAVLRGDADYQSGPNWQAISNAATCTMYGSMDMSQDSARVFDPDCTSFLRASDASSMFVHWEE